ncbi:MAG: TrmB family transcriptional regulator [Aigarchaeota archaeon]|nr:TrmB family transcriptional regulator [Aigarchaeota archaeon]MCX8192288.1 TrmB family transcriptional regulator [Nitrososphaeria archaeon]MDW7986104.1 helix-turn-helix domain-containing protein [Nitrososphaerota archaeon]
MLVISEDLRRALHNLGLTDYEIKVYTALLETGEATASKLSEVADVPYSKIYDVLESLEKKGWIGTEGGRPAHYYPKSPITALESSRMRLEKEFKTNEEVVISELFPIYEKRGFKERHDIWIIRGEENILTKIKNLLADCEKELLIAAPLITKTLLTIFLPYITYITSKGGTVKIMLPNDVNYSLVKKLTEVAEVRLKEQMFGGGIVSDSREVILLLGDEKGDISFAIWSEHVGLAKFAKNYFEYLWREAEPLEKK